MQIETQPSRGSALWWLVMIGGGCAGIAVAVWLSRPRRSAGASVDASEGN
jgi:hypothetical protein